MHGSPWPYDSAIPLFFVGSQIVPGIRATAASQQDVAVTLAAALGVSMPITATGRVLPVLRPNATKPKAVFVIVLDGMRIDYFDKHAAAMPTLSALRKRSAWFSHARINYLPTNTAAGHSTIATGTDPRIHGITGNNLFDRVQQKRHDMYESWNPRDLTALTLTDVWQLETGGKAVVIAQGSSVPSATALGGHGACQVGGSRTIHAGYDETNRDVEVKRGVLYASAGTRCADSANGVASRRLVDGPQGRHAVRACAVQVCSRDLKPTRLFG